MTKRTVTIYEDSKLALTVSKTLTRAELEVSIRLAEDDLELFTTIPQAELVWALKSLGAIK